MMIPAREEWPSSILWRSSSARSSKVLDGPGTMVAHAAEQDLEILERLCGRGPSSLFDTQIAAGFVGHSSPSLGSLLQSFLVCELPKSDRLTDWRTRPLTPSQLSMRPRTSII